MEGSTPFGRMLLHPDAKGLKVTRVICGNRATLLTCKSCKDPMACSTLFARILLPPDPKDFDFS